MTTNRDFDTAAAITRSMLGWGVVVGPLYLIIGVIKGLVTDGFRFSIHPLSLLMLGEGGWVQRVNLVVAGLLTAVAGIGFGRAVRRVPSVLIIIGAACMVGAAIFPPDPMPGFPPGSQPEFTVSGVLHLALGGVQFAVLGAAAIVTGRWIGHRGDRTAARLSMAAGVVIIAGFLGGAVLSAVPGGVALLWLAVLVTFGWLAMASIYSYRTVSHPDRNRI